MTRVLILGAGGHAQVVADALLRAREAGSPLEPLGFLDDDPGLLGTRILDLPVLGTIADLEGIDHDAAFVAIGHNPTRARLFTRLADTRELVVNVLHPKATLSPTVRLGDGVLACAGVVVNTGASLGENTIVNTSATVDHHCALGAHCHVAPGVHLGGGVQVGEGTLLGIGSVVMPGLRVGRWCIVGAGSVVTRDLPDNVTAAGVPARVINLHPADWHRQ